MYQVKTFPWLVVSGHDPEFADFSNPTGALIREAVGVMIETQEGYRYGRILEVKENVEAVVEFYQVALACGLDPAQDPRLCVDYAYGSEAYQHEGGAWEAEWERSQF